MEKDNKVICPEHNKEATVRVTTKRDPYCNPLLLGVSNLKIIGIRLVKCEDCKSESPIFPNLSELLKGIYHHLSNQDEEYDGEDIKYIRKYLGEDIPTFAKSIGTPVETIERLENTYVKEKKPVYIEWNKEKQIWVYA